MTQNLWYRAWQDAQHSPSLKAGLVLVALNGLTIAQVETLQSTQIDLIQGWLTTQDQATFPLTSYSQEVLREFDASQFNSGDVQSLFDQYQLTEEDAHRRLSGAIWITSEDGKLMQEMLPISNTTPILPLEFTFPISIVHQLERDSDTEISALSRVTLQRASDWLYEEVLQPKQRLTIGVILGILLSGKVFFLLSNTGVNGINFIHNIFMGRLLSPEDYGSLSLLITLQLFVGLIPTGMQTVSARFSSLYTAHENYVALSYLRWLGNQFTFIIGFFIMLILLLLAQPLANLFQLPSAWLVLPIAIAVPAFVSIGTDRGILQGLDSFYWLSAAYLAEGIIRLAIGLGLGYALLSAGRELDGAVWGVAQAMIFTWFISWIAVRRYAVVKQPVPNSQKQHLSTERSVWQGLLGLTLMGLVGQALITNVDFLLVKNFFNPLDSGLYAAVTVLGRIAYFGALPLTILAVPMVAKQQALGQSTTRTLVLLVGAGIAFTGGLIGVSTLFSEQILAILYGDAYISAANLLPLYTTAASLFVLTNLMLTYRVALGQGQDTWMALLAGILQAIGIMLFHDSLEQVIFVQIVLMTCLTIAVGWRTVRAEQTTNKVDTPIA